MQKSNDGRRLASCSVSWSAIGCAIPTICTHKYELCFTERITEWIFLSNDREAPENRVPCIPYWKMATTHTPSYTFIHSLKGLPSHAYRTNSLSLSLYPDPCHFSSSAKICCVHFAYVSTMYCAAQCNACYTFTNEIYYWLRVYFILPLAGPPCPILHSVTELTHTMIPYRRSKFHFIYARRLLLTGISILYINI